MESAKTMDGFTETISGSTGIDCPSIVSEV